MPGRGRGKKTTHYGAFRTKAPPKPKALDPRDAKMGPIQSWEDLADEQDAFHMERDKVLLEDDGRNGDEYEESEEEVLALDHSDSDGESEDDHEDARDPAGGVADDSSDDEKEEEEDGVEGWGSKAKEYYGGDEPQNEEDLALEEAEALRIQERQLAKMNEADFLPDIEEWESTPADASMEKEEAWKVVTEALPKNIPDSMPPEERLKILQARHPEFEPLRQEFVELQQAHGVLELSAKAAEAVGETVQTSIIIKKFHVLSAYLGVLSMYFAVLTSEDAVESQGSSVKEHPVMEGLMTCREMWNRVKDLESEPLSSKEQDRKRSEMALVKASEPEKRDRETKEGKRKRKRIKLDKEDTEMNVDSKTTKRAKSAAIDDQFGDLAHLTKNFKQQKSSKTLKPAVLDEGSVGIARPSPNGMAENDFGDDSVLNPLDAEEKAARKKNLRFYASQIVSKSAKRERAGRDTGGDHDLPYRERRKERELRLRAEAQKRRSEGADLDDEEPDEEDRRVAKQVNQNDSDNEYYDLLAATSKKRKAEKKALHDTIRDAERAGDRVDIKAGEVGADGKRAIGWTIQKNKGLTAHRKKEVRNPRVKKRNKYEKAKKKLSSTKAVYKGGLKGSYGGEATGIKTGLVKSVKFAS